MKEGQIQACCHRIDWRLADFPDEELPESAKKHIADMIYDGYWMGELCVLGEDGDTEYRGWWSINRE